MNKVVYIFTIFILSSVLVSAQNTFSLGIEGGVKLQTSSLADVWNAPGSRGAVFGTYGMSSIFNSDDEAQLILKAGYYKTNTTSKFDDTYGNFVHTSASIDWPLTVIPVTLGIKYIFTPQDLRPYITASAGVAFMKLSQVSATYPTGTVSNNSPDATTNSFMFTGGVGAQYRLTRMFYVDINAQYEGIVRDIGVPTLSGPATLEFISYNIGIGFYF
jgi:Outer membrane protein beta-barrel domain